MIDFKKAIEEYTSNLPDDDYLDEYCDYTQFKDNIEGLIDGLIEQYHEKGSNQIERWRNSCDINNYDEFPSELKEDVVDFAVKQVWDRIKKMKTC